MIKIILKRPELPKGKEAGSKIEPKPKTQFQIGIEAFNAEKLRPKRETVQAR